MVIALSWMGVAGACGGEPEEGPDASAPVEQRPARPADPTPRPDTTPVPDTVPAEDAARDEEPRDRPAGDASTVTDRVAWTIGVTDRAGRGRMATATAVRVARHDGFDRFVVEFTAGSPAPGYHIEHVDRPAHECGSGNEVRLPGDGWLQVRIEPAQAHDDEGRGTVRARSAETGLPNVIEYRMTCDFEGQVEWILALRSPTAYRVYELDNPRRLAVDVRHPR